MIVEAVFGRLEALPPVGSAAAGGGDAAASAPGTSAAADADVDADSTGASEAAPQPGAQPRAHRLDSGEQINCLMGYTPVTILWWIPFQIPIRSYLAARNNCRCSCCSTGFFRLGYSGITD